MSNLVKELKCKTVLGQATNSRAPYLFIQLGSKNGNFLLAVTTSPKKYFRACGESLLS